MKIHRVDELGHPIKQGSRAWWALRLGVATASEMHRLVTEKNWDYAAGARTYIIELLLEKRLGAPLEPYDPADRWRDAPTEGRFFSSWTERGTVLEREARTLYEVMNDVEVEQVAFVTNDAGDFGYSPDGLVGTDGQTEIKCYGLKSYVQRLLGLEPLAKDAQIQGGLWITEREWCDVQLYMPHEAFPTYVKRFYRHDDYIKKLEEAAEKFRADMEKAAAKLDSFGSGVWLEEHESMQSLLMASLTFGKGKKAERELSVQETRDFSAALDRALAAEILDAADRRKIEEDIKAGDWESVRSMWTYMQRHEALELVP